jgi:hypothetical protein
MALSPITSEPIQGALRSAVHEMELLVCAAKQESVDIPSAVAKPVET